MERGMVIFGLTNPISCFVLMNSILWGRINWTLLEYGMNPIVHFHEVLQLLSITSFFLSFLTPDMDWDLLIRKWNQVFSLISAYSNSNSLLEVTNIWSWPGSGISENGGQGLSVRNSNIRSQDRQPPTRSSSNAISGEHTGRQWAGTPRERYTTYWRRVR